MYELIKNVMNIYELSHEYVYICMFLFDFCLFLSCALCLCITMMDVSDDYMQGELCLIECSNTNYSLKEDEY